MTNVLNRLIKQAGSVLLGGAIATGVVGGGLYINKLSTDGTIVESQKFEAFAPIVLDLAATGSTSYASGTAYDSACVANPFGSTGAVMHGRYHNIANPAGAAVYVGFVDACNDVTASGADLLALADSCSSTGCSVPFGYEDVTWGGDKYLKAVINKDPLSSFDGKLTLWYEDILGD